MIEERYIIDTDPGDDIDDAFAITLAVTTVIVAASRKIEQKLGIRF